MQAQNQPTIAQESPHYNLTTIPLIGGEIIFEVFQPLWSGYLNVTDGQTGDIL